MAWPCCIRVTKHAGSMVGVLLLKVLNVALLFLHLLHLGLDLLLEALAHLDYHEHQNEQTQDADHDV